MAVHDQEWASFPRSVSRDRHYPAVLSLGFQELTPTSLMTSEAQGPTELTAVYSASSKVRGNLTSNLLVKNREGRKYKIFVF